MTNNFNFYEWFTTISSKLENRETAFKKIFKYLDSQPTPIIIVETGCLRKHNNFLDGQSTLLFDKYTLFRGNNSKVYTVDISSKSTQVCSEVVSRNVDITTEDSVFYLNKLSNKFLKSKTKVSMFYLDSFDLDWRYPFPSAAHHLKEVAAITKILDKNTLVVVDDSPANANVTHIDDHTEKKTSDKLGYIKDSLNWNVIGSPSPPPTIGGKGFLVHEYATHVGAKLVFSHYQTAWKGFNNE